MNIFKKLNGNVFDFYESGWAVFQNEDGTITKLNWEELKLPENGKKYRYDNTQISNKSVGKMAFSYCSNLVSITIPNSVTNICHRAFDSCKNLKIIKIPDFIGNMESEAFFYCESLESIELPDSLTRISNKTFQWCLNLKSVKMGKFIEYIDYSAFCDTDLRTIVIPDTVKWISSRAFECCSLEKIEYKGHIFATRRAFFRYFKEHHS